MRLMRRTLLAAAAGIAAAALAGWGGPAAAQSEPIRVAFGDIASVESLNLLIAMERTKERGIPMELTFFNEEDVAVQAVLSGEADIGVGAPYAFIQNSEAPIRMFFRMSTLLFFPVVNGEVYKGWEDLDGQEVAVQSRGSGTEALMRLMEKQHGIKFSNISFVPGSEVRAGAMLQGTINASIVDAANFRLLQEEGGGKFVRLPIEGVNATDEALYARADFLEERAADVQVFVEELLRTWKDVAANPAIVGELREQVRPAAGPARGRARRGGALLRGGGGERASIRSTAASRRTPATTSPSWRRPARSRATRRPSIPPTSGTSPRSRRRRRRTDAIEAARAPPSPG